ncbi:hypothetical protein I8F73_04550 [Enterococcus faecalis]|nr:hypothetical protein [Enterococcus faecalis]
MLWKGRLKNENRTDWQWIDGGIESKKLHKKEKTRSFFYGRHSKEATTLAFTELPELLIDFSHPDNLEMILRIACLINFP